MSLTLLVLCVAPSVPLFDARAPLAAEQVPFADCGSCHPRAAQTHARSMHAQASTNAVYLAGLDREPMQWCENCHHPARQSQEPGVGCLSCHVREGRVLSAHESGAAAERAHPMRVEPSLARSELCGECHQFAFPVGRREPVVASAHPIQNTLAEWREHGGATGCQGCHMPAGSHAMAGGHDAELMRKSLEVIVQRAGPEVRVSLAAHGVAHRVPTGDPFHRLRVRLCADEACSEVVRQLELGREVVRDGPSWRIARDRTLASRGERSISLEAPAAAKWWVVAMRYAAPSSESLLAAEERELVIAGGEIESK